MKKTIAVMLSVSLLSSVAVMAQPAKSAKQAAGAIEARQAIFKLVKSNVGILGAMNKGAVPFDAEILQTNAKRLEQLSLMVEDYFATDTSKFDLDTEAVDDIWKNQADFNEKADALTLASVELYKAAAAGDESKYKSAIGGVFKTCKGCHDSYKAD
ncbi:c-type cytochrome [Paraglaciecola sp. 2405UD69-4]|uniref:c-type cytochrome n=1 Tax=Paraglaciecola sp. 2405UD69-4 TaxID=3391836 RepID=UPI0039C975A3